MTHVYRNKKQLVSRIKKIQGQLGAVVKRLETDEGDCFSILQTLAATRGALNGLMNQLVQGHIVDHIVKNPNAPESESEAAAMQLASLLRTYWK